MINLNWAEENALKVYKLLYMLEDSVTLQRLTSHTFYLQSINSNEISKRRLHFYHDPVHKRVYQSLSIWYQGLDYPMSLSFSHVYAYSHMKRTKSSRQDNVFLSASLWCCCFTAWMWHVFSFSLQMFTCCILISDEDKRLHLVTISDGFLAYPPSFW